MRVHYEDIKAYNFNEAKAVANTLRSIATRLGEPLTIECQSKRKGWMPSFALLESADRFILDGKLIKNRYQMQKKVITLKG